MFSGSSTAWRGRAVLFPVSLAARRTKRGIECFLSRLLVHVGQFAAVGGHPVWRARRLSCRAGRFRA